MLLSIIVALRADFVEGAVEAPVVEEGAGQPRPPPPPSWKPRARPRGAAAQGRLRGPGVANSLQTSRRDLRLAGSDVPHPTCSRPVRRFRASDLAERALSSSPKRSLESRLPSVGAGVAPPPKWSSLRPEAGQEETHTPARSRVRLAPVAAGGLVPGERGTLWMGAGHQQWPQAHRLTLQRLFTSLKLKK